MRKWTKLGFILLMAVVLVGAGTGAHALSHNGNPDYSGSLPGIPLIKPVLAQNSGDFPDPNIGLSAYVKSDPGEIDFDAMILDMFKDQPLTAIGANYVIGSVPIRQNGPRGTPRTILLHTYVDTSGWRIAYLPKGTINSAFFTWTNWDPACPSDNEDCLIFTVQEKALQRITQYLEEPLDLEAVGWYHWAHPDANRLQAAVKAGQGNLHLSVPSDVTLYGPSIPGFASYSFDTSGSTCASLRLFKGGVHLQHLDNCRFGFRELNLLERDTVYTFKISGPGRLGVVVLYSQP